MRLSLATKVFLGFAVVVCTFGAVSALSVVTLHRVGEGIRSVSQAYLPLTKEAAQVETFHKNRAHDLQRLLDERDRATQQTLIKLARRYYPEAMHKRIQEARGQIERAIPLSPLAEQPFLSELQTELSELDTSYTSYDQKADRLFSLLEAEHPDQATVGQGLGELLAVQQHLDTAIKRISQALEAHLSLRVTEASAAERHGAWTIILFTLAAILLGLLVTVASLRVLAPIRRLTEGAVRIGRGDYSVAAAAQGSDEIAVLAREFNAMAANLRERERQLEQKQSELVRAERLAAMGRVTAQITHEIRNPLSSIGLNAEMLEEAIEKANWSSPAAARESQELLKAISREVDRLTEVTEEYLRFARAPKPQLAPEDASAVVRSLLDFSAEELKQAGVQVDRDLGSPAWALVDEGQLRQALLNLLRNAREAFAGKPGRVKVGSHAGDRWVEVSVADDGPGIAQEDLARIFEPFFSTKQRGTGLGLAVTQQIVREHGGELSCESTPGAGTCFTVRLPRAVTTPSPGAATA